MLLRAQNIPVAVFLVASLVSCTGPSGGSTVPGTPAVSPDHRKARATVLIRIKVPRRHRHHGERRGKYISPATQSVAITAVQGTATTTYNANLTPATNPNCNPATLVCALQLQLAAGKYTVGFATFDGLLDPQGSPTGNELSAAQNVPLTVVVGQTNSVAVTLAGLPASVAVIPGASSTLTGGAGSYALSRCNPGPQPVSVFALDADGNYILGPGAPSVTLTTNNQVALAVSTPAPSTPSQFTLSPPTAPNYAGFNTAVQLTAGATEQSIGGSTSASAIVEVTYSATVCGAFTEYPLPSASSAPDGITVGPDGAIWFTELSGNRIGRIPLSATVADPQITEFAIPTANSNPNSVATGPDGALWFTEHNKAKIGRLVPGVSGITEYTTPTTLSSPYGITAAGDHAMWFTECGANQIGKITTTGNITEYPIPTASSGPQGIALGLGSTLWFVEEKVGKVGMITNYMSPFTEFAIPVTGVSSPRSLALGPNGAMWLSDSAGKVGEVSAAGSISMFTVPGNGAPQGMTAGPDGAMWFDQFSTGGIARVAIDGSSILSFPIPTASAQPRHIVQAPDGTLWFTEFGGNKIGRLQ